LSSYPPATGWPTYNLRNTCLVMKLKFVVILGLTVNRPVCFPIGNPIGAHDQIFITVDLLWLPCGVSSLARGRVCNLFVQLPPSIASAVKHRVQVPQCLRPYLTPSFKIAFPFYRLLRFVGLRWRYSNPPPHKVCLVMTAIAVPRYIASSRTTQKIIPKILLLPNAIIGDDFHCALS
jgi:hypothetical protein